MRAAVLCYHSINVHGGDYASNDHVALAEDLRMLHRLGLPIRPLHALADALDGGAIDPAPCVALSFDDGSWFDWHDLEHPAWGLQRSFANLLDDFARDTGAAAPATSFVIASPEARARLDQTCLVGRGWWSDEWWADAVTSGRLAIESHSLDHQHETLERTASGLPGGRFDNVLDHAAADAEIRRASDVLDALLPQRRTRLFAYPYGQTTPYLLEEYLPGFRAEHRLDAAFGTRPEPVHAQAPRWDLGRYICGFHWNSPEGLRSVLRDALGVG
jgi:peptidoglycan/xylan/chitin deacetylase (PgdA/CDA1 family)